METLERHRQKTQQASAAMDELLRLHKELCAVNTDLGKMWEQGSGASKDDIAQLTETSKGICGNIQKVREEVLGAMSQDSLLNLRSQAESMHHSLLEGTRPPRTA